jgi:hypothetical protein
MVLVLARFESSTSTAKAEYEYEDPEHTGVQGHLNKKMRNFKTRERAIVGHRSACVNLSRKANRYEAADAYDRDGDIPYPSGFRICPVKRDGTKTELGAAKTK